MNFINTLRNITVILLALIAIIKPVYSFENKILFKVNNEIITSIDIVSEIEYLGLINKNLNQLTKEKLFEIGKNSAIREKVKKINLTKYFENFEVDKKYYNSIFLNFLRRANIKDEYELQSILKEKNLNIDIIENKLKIEILWNQLIVNKYSKDIKIDKVDIRNNILEGNTQKEFLLSEIVFRLDTNKSLDEKFAIIKNEISAKGFSNTALIYSISDTSKNGGNLGWIKINSLNKTIRDILQKLKIGDVSEPIVIPGGFLVLKIEDERKSRIINDIDKQIEIIANETANKQLNQFANIYYNKIEKDIEFHAF
ncbi:peptidylprolyl isomerase [Candidatus Pelagibacter sp. HIMB1695]|uniref:peptidylprolyl isomerase n=1 Tax=Candidatus Pelagibacter sp. HIMB1695 TaxID=3413364 RepID=UPI003F83547C